MTEQELLDLREGAIIVNRDTGHRYRVQIRYARLVVVAPCIEDDTLIIGAEHANQWTKQEKQP